jgi:hypothetical protein
MGRDKVESEVPLPHRVLPFSEHPATSDEDLIKYAWPRDVWFHVDKLSSAHVYLRLPDFVPSWENIPQSLIQDCSQLVKANSIEGAFLNLPKETDLHPFAIGNKKDNLTIIYTPSENLKVYSKKSPEWNEDLIVVPRKQETWPSAKSHFTTTKRSLFSDLVRVNPLIIFSRSNEVFCSQHNHCTLHP